MKTTRSVVLTHVVNPHQFYFKYLDECINSEFTKFDIKLQEYALELHADARYEEGHSPIESELVLFYHIIFNKWIRARVICIDEQYTLWCVDNGVLAKCTKKVILPLATRLHDDMKLVHLGGLSLLPTEKTFNNDTSEIEIQYSEKWDNEMIATFKAIVNNSKTIAFTEDFELPRHKFGSLIIESKSDKIIVINNTIVEMNKGGHISADSQEDLLSYVSDDCLENQLYQSLNDGPSIPATKLSKPMNFSKRLSDSSTRTKREMSSTNNLAASESYDDTASTSNDSHIIRDCMTRRRGGRTGTLYSKSSRATSLSNSNNLSTSVMSLNIDNSENECHDDFDDSASIAMSTVTITNETRSSSSLSYRNESRASYSENDYECNLRTCSTVGQVKLRPPLQSSINWINSMCKSEDNKSFVSSINNSNEIECTSQKSPPPDMSTTTKRRSTVAKKECNNNEATSFNDVNSNYSKPNTKTANNLDWRQKNYGVPGGYAKNCLDTFGGMTRRN